ncbi:hypothetical protein AMJ49_02820 [Parcubacteria bacterium DG_74_2]|nr:MAG: hypothetical protein AMJ49_02820 [Parcubacteria bacterium DG_74_2]
MRWYHIPVLKNEVLEYLNPKPDKNFIDCTIGGGGHTKAILEKNGPKGRVLGIELDAQLYEKILKLNIDRLILVHDSYTNLREITERKNFRSISGILFDLGLSNWHLKEGNRGFSFLKNESLDMRYNSRSNLTVEKIVNDFSEQEIEKILKVYGEERFAKRISKKIVEERKKRKIQTTFQLVGVIKKAVPDWYQHKKIHFATKTFQALRIVVNKELENLKIALPQTLKILERNGRLIVISFHSLEDRIVKNFLKENSKKGLIKILTKKPVRPSLEEVKKNPKARSAKLRSAIKL